MVGEMPESDENEDYDDDDDDNEVQENSEIIKDSNHNLIKPDDLDLLKTKLENI